MKLSKQQVEEIVVAREGGETIPVLAKRYGVGHSTITYHCDRHGVVPPRGLRRGKARVTRGTAFSDAELENIRKLSCQGLSPLKIAQKIGRPYSSVRYRLVRMALADEAATLVTDN